MNVSVCLKEPCPTKQWLEEPKIVVVDLPIRQEMGGEVALLHVDSVDVFKVDEVKRGIRHEHSRVAAFGGLYAVNVAKLLTFPIHPRKSLLDTVFEAAPRGKVIVYPLEPALCTELTGWMLFHVKKIPAYLLVYRPRLRPRRVFIWYDEFVENLRRRRHIYYAIAFDAAIRHDSRVGTYLSKNPSFSGYMNLCSRFEKTGPGPLLSLLLSISALAGLEILDSTKNLVCHLMRGFKGLFEKEKRDSPLLGRILYMAYGDEECGELGLELREKTLDIYVEHSWSFYSPSFRGTNMSRADIYIVLKNIVSISRSSY